MSKTIYTMVDFAAQTPPDAGKFLVGYDLDGKLKQMDHDGVVTEIGSGGGGGGVTPLAWADLKALADSAGMTPGAFYLITDFRTRHAIPRTDPVEYWEDSAEPLLVQAGDASSLRPEAWSAAFPGDYLEYEIEDTSDQGGDMGRITRRRSPEGLDAHYDWRGVKFRRWALSAQAFDPMVAYTGGKAVLNMYGNVYMCVRDYSGPNDPSAEPNYWALVFSTGSNPYLSPFPSSGLAMWNIAGVDMSTLSVDDGDYVDAYTFGDTKTPDPAYFHNAYIGEDNVTD